MICRKRRYLNDNEVDNMYNAFGDVPCVVGWQYYQVLWDHRWGPLCPLLVPVPVQRPHPRLWGHVQERAEHQQLWNHEVLCLGYFLKLKYFVWMMFRIHGKMFIKNISLSRCKRFILTIWCLKLDGSFSAKSFIKK